MKTVKHDFRSYINNHRAVSQKDASVEGYWRLQIGVMDGQKAQPDINFVME